MPSEFVEPHNKNSYTLKTSIVQSHQHVTWQSDRTPVNPNIHVDCNELRTLAVENVLASN